ncbi:MAG: DNA cytosine methyltransferase, partial [Lentisphaeria bacterium]|nr:DNA cytosine methyltransferase [Lentisphaeria bacterium]
MHYGSICSGVEAASLAWRHLGWTPAFFSEVEPFPAAVLMQQLGATKPIRPLDPDAASDEKDRKQRLSWQSQIAELPDGGTIPNLGDFTLIKKDDYDGQIDMLVGGTPCQDLSIAGKRLGFDGKRSVLALDFVRLCFETGTRWVLWENVPATLSSHNGEDFARFVSLLCGWDIPVPSDGWRKSGIVTGTPGHFGVSWRILDAQYTRVEQFPRAIPQRRKRLFLVGHLDSWKYPAQVLFDGEMCGGNSPPRRTKGQTPAASAEGCFDTAESIRMRAGKPGGGKGALVAHELSLTLATGNDQTIVTFPKNGGEPRKNSVECLDTRQVDVHDTDLAPTLIATDYKGGKAICFQQNSRDEVRLMSQDGAVAGALMANPGAKQQNYLCYENHAPDSRIKPVEVSQSIVARMGTGGGNLPLVKEPDVIGFIKNDAGGVQQGFWKNVFPTLRAAITPAITWNECFHLSFCDANGTRKDRKNGGLYVTKAETSQTVTAKGPHTETVIIALDGDKMAKAERKGGSGLGVSEDGVMYTQTAKDVHAVAYDECVPLDLRNATRDPEKHDTQNRQGVGVG